MGSMLGVVLSDNVILLFVFWELTGFTSFLLIGFEHERADARAAATQALIVTGGGGLALLAAGVLLVDVAGTPQPLGPDGDAGGHRWPARSTAASSCLVLLAAFTKSAQFPFHFWLPNAMEAPTPVSAYLHSATMVKAGVYLMARMTPILGADALVDDGGHGRRRGHHGRRRLSLRAGNRSQAHPRLLDDERAWHPDDAARVGTREAIVAALAYLLAHACYKGALFLVAGAIDHETGTRDVAVARRTAPNDAADRLGGALAAASMAGIPLFSGFIAKEQFYEAYAARRFPVSGVASSSRLPSGRACASGGGIHCRHCALSWSFGDGFGVS